MPSMPPFVAGADLAHMLYGRAYSAAYREYRLENPSLALASDPEAQRKLLLDDTVRAASTYRQHLVAGRAVTFEPASDDPQDVALADVVRDAMLKIQGFGEARNELAKCFLTGQAWAFIEGHRTRCKLGETVQDWLVPIKLVDVDRLRFRLPNIQSTDGNFDHTQLSWMSATRNRWEIADRNWFVCSTYGSAEANLGHGGGLMDTLWFLLWQKGRLWQEGLNLIERWAGGLAIVKVDSLRDGSTGKNTDAIVNSTLATIEKTRARHALVIDKADEFEIQWPQGTGAQIIEAMIRLIDTKIDRVILNATLPTGGGEDVGSNARSEVEEGSTEALVQYDRQRQEEDLDRDLVIGYFLRHNRPQLAAAGLSGARPPRTKISVEKRQDPKANADMIAVALNAGIPLPQKWVYDALDCPAPAQGEAVFGGQPRLPMATDPNGAPQIPVDADGLPPKIPDDAPAADALRELLARREEPPVTPSFAMARIEREDARVSAAADRVDALSDRLDGLLSNREHQIPRITVHVDPPPPANVVVNVEKPDPVVVTVNVPEQKHPVVNVAAPQVHVAPPTVNVHAPKPPEVTVNVPPQEAPKPPPQVERVIKFTTDAEGNVTGATSKPKE